jgi:hypothetical protein
MPIAAGVVGNGRVAAVLAAFDMAAERRRATAFDSAHNLELVEADVTGIGYPPCRTVIAENIRDFQGRAQHSRRASARCLNLLELDRDVLQRAHDRIDGPGRHPRVERRVLKLSVAEQHLNHANVGVLFQQMRGEAVP